MALRRSAPNASPLRSSSCAAQGWVGGSGTGACRHGAGTLEARRGRQQWAGRQQQPAHAALSPPLSRLRGSPRRAVASSSSGSSGRHAHLAEPGVALLQNALLLLQPRLRQRRAAGRRLRLVQPRVQRGVGLRQGHAPVGGRRQPRLQLADLRLLLLRGGREGGGAAGGQREGPVGGGAAAGGRQRGAPPVCRSPRQPQVGSVLLPLAVRPPSPPPPARPIIKPSAATGPPTCSSLSSCALSDCRLDTSTARRSSSASRAISAVCALLCSTRAAVSSCERRQQEGGQQLMKRKRRQCDSSSSGSARPAAAGRSGPGMQERAPAAHLAQRLILLEQLLLLGCQHCVLALQQAVALLVGLRRREQAAAAAGGLFGWGRGPQALAMHPPRMSQAPEQSRQRPVCAARRAAPGRPARH